MTESEQLENNAVQYTLGYKDGFLEAKKQFERPAGEWIALKLPITEEEGDIKIICSNCKDEFIGQNDLETWIKVYYYCPSCGAKMEKRHDQHGETDQEQRG